MRGRGDSQDKKGRLSKQNEKKGPLLFQKKKGVWRIGIPEKKGTPPPTPRLKKKTIAVARFSNRSHTGEGTRNGLVGVSQGKKGKSQRDAKIIKEGTSFV